VRSDELFAILRRVAEVSGRSDGLDRYKLAPRTTPERIIEGLNAIEEAFGRAMQPSGPSD